MIQASAGSWAPEWHSIRVLLFGNCKFESFECPTKSADSDLSKCSAVLRGSKHGSLKRCGGRHVAGGKYVSAVALPAW